MNFPSMLKLGCNGVEVHSYSSLHFDFRRMLLSSYYSTEPKPKIPSSSSSSSSSFSFSSLFVKHLVSSLGFSEQQSLSTLNKLIQYRPGRDFKQVIYIKQADSVVNFLKQNGFQLSQIRKLISSDPRILFSKVDKTLKPRIDILQELGLSGTRLAYLVYLKPGLLCTSMINPATIEALRAVVGSDSNETIIMILRKSRWRRLLTVEKNLIPNVALLEKTYAIPFERIQKCMIQQPTSLMHTTESFRDVLHEIEHKWGIPRDSGMFLHAIFVIGCSNAKTLDSKCQIFTSFGWTPSEVMQMIKVNVNFLTKSESNIKKRLDFLMNELGLKPAYVASHPAFFTYSLEGRIVPRHKVLNVLKERGLIRETFMLYSAVCLTESKFLEKFIWPYMGVIPNILDVYNSGRAHSGMLPIQGRAKSQPPK